MVYDQQRNKHFVCLSYQKNQDYVYIRYFMTIPLKFFTFLLVTSSRVLLLLPHAVRK